MIEEQILKKLEIETMALGEQEELQKIKSAIRKIGRKLDQPKEKAPIRERNFNLEILEDSMRILNQATAIGLKRAKELRREVK